MCLCLYCLVVRLLAKCCHHFILFIIFSYVVGLSPLENNQSQHSLSFLSVPGFVPVLYMNSLTEFLQQSFEINAIIPILHMRIQIQRLGIILKVTQLDTGEVSV